MVIELSEHSNEDVCTCTLACLIHQSIALHISYLYCEYQLIWTFNEWFKGISILANQNKEHAHAWWNIYVHLYADVYLSYLCCEFELIYGPLYISQSKPSTHACACVLVFSGIPIHRFRHYLLMLWISTQLKIW
jgi:hypothetical protein